MCRRRMRTRHTWAGVCFAVLLPCMLLTGAWFFFVAAMGVLDSARETRVDAGIDNCRSVDSEVSPPCVCDRVCCLPLIALVFSF